MSSKPTIPSREQETLVRMIKRLRESRGVGQRDLARTLGKHRNYIYKIEQSRDVGVAELLEILRILDTDPLEFFKALLDEVSLEEGKNK